MPATSTHLADVRTAQLPAGEGSGQDRVFVLPSAVVVLDGASSQEPGHYDGGWYADTLGRQVAGHLRADETTSLPNLLAAAIADVASIHGLTAGTSPSSTVAILRWTDEQVEGLVLGDSPIVVFTTSGHVDQIRDDRLAHVAPSQRRAYVQRLQAGGGYDAQHRELLRQLQNAQRAKRNTEGGYWIAEVDPDAAHHAQTRHWRRADLEAALVTTDGIARGIEQYGTPPSWSQALNISRQYGPDQLTLTVHQTEENDPHGKDWPRSKSHDDKALALVDYY